MKKLEVGQKVFFLACEYRNNHSQELQEMTVSVVGKKYFELNEWPRDRFFIETMKHDGRNYMSNGIVYINKEDYYEEIRLNHAISDISDFFKYNPKKLMSSDVIYQIYNLVKSCEDQY